MTVSNRFLENREIKKLVKNGVDRFGFWRLVVRHLDYCKIGFFSTISNSTVSYVACRVAHFKKSIA